jgi:hypothetical protein
MARTLTRPMFRKGGMARREEYMGGGMTGIMTGIMPTQPDAGLNPRMGLAGGGNIGGGIISGMSMGNRTGFETPRIVGQGPYLQGSSYGKGFNITRLPATTPGVPANVANAGQKIVNAATKNYPLTVIEKATKPSRFAGILNKLKKIPGASKLAGLSRFSPYAAAAATGVGLAQAADYVTKSTDTPAAYAFRKELVDQETGDPFYFDETNLDVGEGLDEIARLDKGEKYGFFPRGGKEQRLKDLGLEDQFDAKTGKRIKGTKKKETNIINIPDPDKKEDPEKSLMDVYGENKGIIDQVMGNADEDTKKSMYLQLAKFGAGLLAQPGGDLVGAIGKAAEKPLEGAEATLAEKRKGDRDTKLLALQKTFDDMKEPEQIKYIKAIQKEYGLDSFEEAYELITKPKKSSAEMRADDEFYRKTGEQMGVSADGFKREMKKLEGTKFEDLIGVLSRNDASLPKEPEDRTNYEYYIQPKDGKPVRSVDGKLYKPGEPEFIMPIPTTET